jgi:hypothetical protein
MKTIATYAENVLNENYNRFVSRWDEQNPADKPHTIAEWCELESQSDPDFYRWLFNDCDIADFGNNLTDEELKTANDYFQTL